MSLELARSVGKPHPAIQIFLDALDRLATCPDDFPDLQVGFSRPRRHERLTAMALLFKAQALRTDLVTWRIGLPHPTGDGFLQGLRMGQPRSRPKVKDTIESWTGIAEGRLWRASADGMRAGYQVSKLDKRQRRCAPQPREIVIDEATGERRWKGYSAIRKWDRTLFKRLGIATKMDEAAAAAAKDRRAEAEKRRRDAKAARLEAERLAAARTVAARAAAADLARGVAKIKTAPAEPNEALRLAELQLQVRTEFPSWPAETVRAEARRRLERPPPE